MCQNSLTLVSSSVWRRSKAAVNAPQSKRFAMFGAPGQTRSVWTAVAFAPLSRRVNFMQLLVCQSIFLMGVSACSAETNSVADADAAYTRTINQRSDKIVAMLGITDTNKLVRVRDIIAGQYRDLNKIHEARDAQIKALKEKSGDDKKAATAAIQAVRDEIKPGLDKLHGEFLAKLSVELSSDQDQVDRVKDGMTYGVAPNTYAVYLKMYPELTAAQKAQIKAWLTEARELAMDGSTSDEKHAVFGKYKGKINNYLSKAGYDAKKAEQNLKQPTAPPSSSPPQ
jgi:Spy/CpxP family protein refolding chaperone